MDNFKVEITLEINSNERDHWYLHNGCIASIVASAKDEIEEALEMLNLRGIYTKDLKIINAKV